MWSGRSAPRFDGSRYETVETFRKTASGSLFHCQCQRVFANSATFRVVDSDGVADSTS